VDSAEDLHALERREITRAIERAEAIAWEKMTAAAPARVATLCGIRAVRVGGAVAALASGIDVLSFNRVMAIGLDEPATEPMIDELVKLYQSAGVRRFFVQPSPETQPPEIVDWLHARGLVHYNDWAKLYRRAEPAPDIPATPRVERIGTERAAMFGQIVATGFGMPEPVQPWLAGTVGREGWIHYLAFDGDVPVAGAALFLHGSLGWLGIASTLPTHRGRGAQGALIARRIRDACEAGCSLMAVETAEDRPERPNPSFRNVVRFGFEVAYLRPNFLLTLPDSPR
jgi:GNAT superfamily N-acetyltransferase